VTHLAGQVALVTGGAGGIGRALCEALAADGARVVVADLDAAGAERVAGAIRSAGAQAEAAALDVADADAFRARVHDTARRHGRLDLLVNAAGVGAWGDARDLPLPLWRRVLDVNLWGVVHGTLAAYEVMAKQGSGRILNVASLAGLVSAPTVTPYAAAKHAVVGFSTSLRAEAADLGVRVAVACPGPVRSGFHAALLVPEGSAVRPRPPADGLDAAEAAREILRGLFRDRAVIVFPGRARWLWWLQRLAPWRIARLNLATVRRMRAAAAARSDGGARP
jgi:NAD(P)-dependent dehydrogenase (short-subunit alcohol dehydrogenase family)